MVNICYVSMHATALYRVSKLLHGLQNQPSRSNFNGQGADLWSAKYVAFFWYARHEQ